MSPLLMFLVAGVGVYLIRISGFTLLGAEREIPTGLSKALRLVAPAAVTAVIASAVLLQDGEIRGICAWHVAAVVAIGVAAWRGQMALTLGAGALAFAGALAVGL